MFHITSYLLILLGIIALPLIENIHFVAFLSFLLFTFGYISTQLYRKFQLSKEIRNALLFFVFILGLAFPFIFGRFGEWEIVWLSWYILFAVQVTNIFSLKNNRSWIFSYLISSLQIAIAGIFTERMLFLVLFLFYLILTVFSSILLLSKIEIKEKFLKLLRSKADFTKWGAVTTVNVFFIAVLIFLILPRTQNPLFEIKKGMHIADKLKKETAGEIVKENLELQFPEKPSLGSFFNVKQKDALVMIIETRRPFLWRVKSFNSYKDGEWSSIGSRPVKIRIKNKKVSLKPIYLRKELFAKIKPEQFYYQKVYIRNYAQNLIIGAYPIIEIDNIPGNNIKIDHFENIYLENKIGIGSSYEVISIDKKYSSDYLRSLPRKYPQEIMNLYLRLPFDLDRKILDLTDKILKNTPSNIYDEVVILKRYLEKNCKYGLISKSNKPTLSEFLFGKKEGDCEYFATALALMLRYRNIPTRFVIGFSGGEFDSQKRMSMVYARNAHAWVEIFFPTIGWLPCDVASGRVYRRQWSDIPSVVVLKSEEQPMAKGPSSLKREIENKGIAKKREIVKEGVPENELLPDEYLFREELAVGKAEQKEVVFGKEFFEKETAAAGTEQELEEVSAEETAAGTEQELEEVSAEETAAGTEQELEEFSAEETAAGTEQELEEVFAEETAAGTEQELEKVSAEETAAGTEQELEEVFAGETAAGTEQELEEVSAEETAAGTEQELEEVSAEETAAAGEQTIEEGFLEEEVPLEEQVVSEAEERPMDAIDEGISEEVVSSEKQETPGETKSAALEEEKKEEIKPIPDLDVVKGEEKISDEEIVFEEEILAEEEVSKEGNIADKKLIEEKTPEEKLSEKKHPGETAEKELTKEGMVSEENKLLAELSYNQPQEPIQETIEEKLPDEKRVAENVSAEKSVFDEVDQEQMNTESAVSDKFFILKWLKDKLKKWVLKYSYYTQKMITNFFKNIAVQITIFVKEMISKVVLHVKGYRLSYLVLLGSLVLLALCRHIIFRIIRKRTEKEKIARLFPQRRLTQEEKAVTNFYLYVLRLLEKIGYKRYPYLTPREFAQQLLAKGFKISKGFLFLTDMFYKISFGHMEVSPVELQKIHKITNDIKGWTKEMKY